MPETVTVYYIKDGHLRVYKHIKMNRYAKSRRELARPKKKDKKKE